MKNKKIIYLILVLLTLFILDRCTLTRISSPSFLEKEEFKTYPLLKDGVVSDSYEIKQITTNSYDDITYDTVNNYFLINRSSEIHKIDNIGALVSTVKLYSDSRYSPFQSQFILGNTIDSLVYDLSKSKIEEKLTNIITTSSQNPLKNWTYMYHKADVVLYRDAFEDIEDVNPIYLRIDNKWTLIMYSNDDYYFIKETFPEKYNKLIFLRDYKNNRYSVSGASPESRFSHSVKYAIDNTNDASEKGIKNIFFRKEYVDARFRPFGYSGFIPTSFGGTGYFHLEKGNELLKFKNEMFQRTLSHNKYMALYHFSIPERYRKKSEVTFLVYKPYRANQIGEGLYIVKRKD